ncbi:MAG: SIMPL domain-containing protein [Patescibacteria group bacterium]
MPIDKGKTILMVGGALALVVGSYAALSYVQTYSRSIEPSSFRSFAVQGEGKVIATPDIAEFTFSVISQGGKDIAKLQKENTERVNRAIGLAKKAGVEEKDIKTEQYSVEPRYQYYSRPPPEPYGTAKPCPPAEITGYTVLQTVLVKVRNFDKVGDILTGVVEAGANSVSRLSFTIDDPAALESAARDEAIAKAQEKAKQIAKAGKFSLGRLLSLDEGSAYPPFYYRSEAKAMGIGGGSDAAMPAPSIEPGSQEIRVNVTLRYEIN